MRKRAVVLILFLSLCLSAAAAEDLPVIEWEPTPSPSAYGQPALSLMAYTIIRDGVVYVAGDRATVAWDEQPGVDIYVAQLDLPDGTVRKLEASGNSVEIDLAGLPAGGYTVRVGAVPGFGSGESVLWSDIDFSIAEAVPGSEAPADGFAWERLDGAPEVRAALADFLGVNVGDPVDEASLAAARVLGIDPKGVRFYKFAANITSYIGSSSAQVLDSDRLSAIAGAIATPGLSVTGLSVQNVPLESLEPLAGLTGLQYLRLFHTGAADLAPLAGLTGLNTLVLNYDDIEDVGPLSGLSNLRTLNLKFNRISDVGPLSGLTALETLVLASNNVRDVSPLSGLTALSLLDLTHNRITDFEPVSHVPAIYR